MTSSFSVRCLFLWREGATQDDAHLYEERVTLWLATSIDHALAQAEAEALRYADVSDCEFLGFSQAYALPESVSVTGVEVFSLLRESKLISGEYIGAFFDTGTERGSGHT